MLDSTATDAILFHLSSMPLAGSLGYLVMVKALGKAMAARAPLTISKPVMVAYNAIQVLINIYVAYVIFAATGGHVWGLGLKDTAAVRHGVFLHYLCKYLDFADTAIIILRKKEEQLSFLHLWHHSTIVVVWGWVVNTWPADASAAYCYGAWINSCIHVVMYAYYAMTAVGIRPPPPLKKAVTSAQLTQFASCIVHAVAALIFDTTPIQYNIVQVLYHIGMLKLFLPLLLGKRAAKAQKKEA